MDKKIIWLSVLAVIISFIGGFLLANAFNRSEINQLRAENGRLKAARSNTNSEADLTADEIRQRIAEADENAQNFSFQKNLGLALYRYGAIKQDVKLLSDTAILLERAHGLNPKDYEVIVGLGNLYFDIGYVNKNNEKFLLAREFYEKALQQRPSDADVRTDKALTYFLENPPQNEKAIAEFQKSLEANPQHEKTLQFLIQAYLKTGKNQEAENYFAKLKQINPSSPSLEDIRRQISQPDNFSQPQ